MIVIYRNGQRTVITGWRALLLIGPFVILAALGIVIVAGFFLGIAITMATLLLFGLPLALGLAFLMQVFQGKR